MKMIVGLGNPGSEYENTRHNVGFMVIDKYCAEEKFQQKFNGLYLTKIINNEKIIFLKPLSYMNLSGIVVSKFAKYFKISPENIVVIRDDLDIELGSAKIKFDSSSGGDNGIKSIINELGTQKFIQLKIGISKKNSSEVKDYVLGEFSKSEKKVLDEILNITPEIIDSLIINDLEYTMNKYNGILK